MFRRLHALLDGSQHVGQLAIQHGLHRQAKARKELAVKTYPMEIKPIRNEQSYRAALQEIESLMNAAPGSPEEDRLDVLATLVKVYEDEHYPIPKPSPIAALDYYLESRSLTRKALEPYIGPPHRVSEIMNRRRRLTLK